MYQLYKNVKVNVEHIQERLLERTCLSRRALSRSVKKVCDELVERMARGHLSRNEEWEIVTPHYKAVGRGASWQTVLRRDEHCSRAILNKWIIN